MKKTRHILNLFKIYYSYLKRKEKVNYLPARLWIETSSRCNLACRLCVNKDIDPSKKGDMDFGLYKKIIDEAKDDVFDINLFHRGEPLLNRHIIDMINYARNRGIKTRIHTNGVLLNSGLSTALIKSGLDLISFSFDGYLKDTYEKNRKGAGYDETLDTIIEFLEIKKELRSKQPFTIIQVMEFDEDLSGKDFQKQKIEFVKRFKNLPLDKITVRKPHNWGGMLDIEGFKKNNSRISPVPCTFLWYSLTIFHDGKVYLCPQDFAGVLEAGDLNKESIKDIFNNKKIQDLRKRFRNKNVNDLKPCNMCDRIWRKTIAGVPVEYLNSFLKDNIR